MIASLNGIVSLKTPGAVVLDVQGVGYEVFISSRTFDVLPEVGEQCMLFIHTSVREDAISLFGFSAAEDKQLFLLLTGVSGIGPKLGLAILSGMSGQELCNAITLQDYSRLTTLQGVGKKTAQRLCVELGEKVTGLHLEVPGPSVSEVRPTMGGGGAMQDAVSALVNLGYPNQTAWQALRLVQKNNPGPIEDVPVEELIRLALQGLANQ